MTNKAQCLILSGTVKQQTFRTWLAGEISKQGLTRREVARRLAAKHPEGVTATTIETYRRAIYKYLDAERPAKPTQPTRQAFADALGVDAAQIPSDDEDEEDDLERALLRVVQRGGNPSRRFEEWIRWGIRNGVFTQDGEEVAA